MWQIYEHKELVKVFRKLPKQVVKCYEVWKRVLEWEGPAGLRKIKGLHNEAVKGRWRGYRSSRLNLKWRVIYKLDKTVCEVLVIDVNPPEY